MPKRTLLSTQIAKPPVYVGVYETLYNQIMRGDYLPNQRLKPEPELAKEFGVSRNTLRQALAILREDGLVINLQGSGNYISPNYREMPAGFDSLENPIFSCTSHTIDQVEMLYNYVPTAAIVQEKMDLTPADIALTGNLIYYQQGKPVSHAFFQVPLKRIQIDNLDLSDDDHVEELLNQKIFDIANISSSRISFTEAEESIAKYLNIPLGTHLIFIEEILYNTKGEAIALCKYYLLPDLYRISVIRKKQQMSEPL